MFKKVYKN